MIRTVAIPRTAARMGQSTSTVTYSGSTCTQFDAEGLCVSDVFLSDATNDAGLPGDPGLAAAVAADAAQQAQSASAASFSQSGVSSPSFALAESLFGGNIPSPLPGLGVTVPDPAKKWLVLIAIVAGVVVLSSSGSTAPRSRR